MTSQKRSFLRIWMLITTEKKMTKHRLFRRLIFSSCIETRQFIDSKLIKYFYHDYVLKIGLFLPSHQFVGFKRKETCSGNHKFYVEFFSKTFFFVCELSRIWVIQTYFFLILLFVICILPSFLKRNPEMSKLINVFKNVKKNISLIKLRSSFVIYLY